MCIHIYIYTYMCYYYIVRSITVLLLILSLVSYPHPRTPATGLLFVILRSSVFSSTWANPFIRDFPL